MSCKWTQSESIVRRPTSNRFDSFRTVSSIGLKKTVNLDLLLAFVRDSQPRVIELTLIALRSESWDEV